MNRPIKFRVWDKVFNCWFSNYLIDLNGNLINSEEVTHYILNKEDFSVMQFTGFHDKNNKEIYEGDLVKHDNVSEPLEVYWCEGTGQWKLGKGEHRHYYGHLYSYPNNLLEVVGNIYESDT